MGTPGFGLSEALGEDGWHKILRLQDYATRGAALCPSAPHFSECRKEEAQLLRIPSRRSSEEA